MGSAAACLGRERAKGKMQGRSKRVLKKKEGGGYKEYGGLYRTENLSAVKFWPGLTPLFQPPYL
jgi:hypothetical protein